MDLIIDTSSQKLTVILNKKNKIITNDTVFTSKHLEHLLEEIDKILDKNNIKLKDVDCFGVVVGPGSFTGIRLAVSTVKAFCFVYPKKKIVSINMLELLVSKIKMSEKNDFCVLTKCTQNKYYLGQMQNGIFTSFVISKEDLIEEMKQQHFIFYSYETDLNKDCNVKNVSLLPSDYVDFVINKIKGKEFINNNQLQPIYMALSQAEEELLKKEKINAKNS